MDLRSARNVYTHYKMQNKYLYCTALKQTEPKQHNYVNTK